jgi:hypothetical protein
LSCVICQVRKEKRFCLAVHGRICSQCCGQQREVTLDCPSECVYLQQARRHEKQRTAEDLKDAELFLGVEISKQFLYEQQKLVIALGYALAKFARKEPSLNDRDLVAGLTALTKSYETRINSGLHYEWPTASLSQRTAATEVQTAVEEFCEAEQKHLGSRLTDSDVLRALVFLVRTVHSRTSGRPKSRAFRDLLLARFAGSKPAILAPDEAGKGIVLP